MIRVGTLEITPCSRPSSNVYHALARQHLQTAADWLRRAQ